jgi:hypothetical protein
MNVTRPAAIGKGSVGMVKRGGSFWSFFRRRY